MSISISWVFESYDELLSRRIKFLNFDNINSSAKTDLTPQIIIQVKTIKFDVYLRRVTEEVKQLIYNASFSAGISKQGTPLAIRIRIGPKMVSGVILIPAIWEFI